MENNHDLWGSFGGVGGGKTHFICGAHSRKLKERRAGWV